VRVRVHDTPPPFHSVYLHAFTSKVVVYAPAEREDTLLLFLLYTLFSSVDVTKQKLNAGGSAITGVLPSWRKRGGGAGLAL
jgi:hypothetical protein